jgi:alpha-D-xyloside xylohydrolase
MNNAQKTQHGLVVRRGTETIRIAAWGESSLRVTIWNGENEPRELNALLTPNDSTKSLQVNVSDELAIVAHGGIVARIDDSGRLCFCDQDGSVLLEEPAHCGPQTPARAFHPRAGEGWEIDQSFRAVSGESFYGLGQHQHGRFDQRGCVIDLRQANTEVSIPFLVSSRGYGFLWNVPALGHVELGETMTRWHAKAAHCIDYWITAADTPRAILGHYADATGHAPPFPKWASGFWQSKLRYKTQAEVLDVAREYQSRALPLSAIVIDFFHWNRLGDFSFDESEWPDPAGMVGQLDRMGVRPVISVWPAFNMNSINFESFASQGLLLRSSDGGLAVRSFIDKDVAGKIYQHFYDPSTERARSEMWKLIENGYYQQGFRVFWLDCCEPAYTWNVYESLVFAEGEGLRLACRYPFDHQRAFYEGMKSMGEEDILFLTRSAWAGSQRFGAAVWSGDIESTFEALQNQIPAGLNMAMSGIPWWNSDIGGFMHGDPRTDYFQELVVRWFQYGTFCPIMRLHGVREPAPDHRDTGAPNEVWSFGDRAYGIMKRYLELRERLRPYIDEHMRTAAECGTPLMRPLLLEYPHDPRCRQVADEYMFGPDILVAPVTERGQTSKEIYLPDGATWEDVWTGEEVRGGCSVSVDVPLERVPLFLNRCGETERDLFTPTVKSLEDVSAR